ncbi:MAG: hypothetical protein ABIP64_03910, partial [Burkholderiales bacterium]
HDARRRILLLAEFKLSEKPLINASREKYFSKQGKVFARPGKANDLAAHRWRGHKFRVRAT